MPTLRLTGMALLATATEAKAADLGELDSGLPTTVEDAFAVELGRFELQGAARYDRRQGRDTVRLLPRVQVGIVEGLEAEIFLPYSVGSGRQSGESNVGAGLLYNLNRERGWLPAFAVGFEVAKPVGPERRSAETELTGIVTKTLDPAMDRRLHLNVAWLRALAPNEEERRDRDANIVEAGLCYQLTEAVTLGAGAGLGVGWDSPRFRAIASVQIGFGGR